MRKHLIETKPLRAAALACLVGMLSAAGAAQHDRRARGETRGATPRVAFTVREAAGEITLETRLYSVSVSREGFDVSVRRGGELVLQSATAGDAATNLGFERGGTQHRVTKMTAFRREADALTLDYETSLQGATARVELRPGPASVRITASLLNNDADLAPSLRYRLAPSGYWYGGGFQGWREPQVIPLNEARIEKSAFFAQGATQGTPVWYSTKGVALGTVARITSKL